MSNRIRETDFLVIGSGIAGLSAALHAGRFGRVVLVTKSSLSTSSSYWAQGGVAAAIHREDTLRNHTEDTLNAGRGYCNENAVELLVREGVERVRELMAMGMKFDKKGDELDLGLEGGHTRRRILHADGASTGRAMIDFLIDSVLNLNNVTVVEDAFVGNLCVEGEKCKGADLWHGRDSEHLRIVSPVTLLATGGYSGLYMRSTNPHTSTGDGLWLASDKGATLKDLEFVQFHPTALYTGDSNTFLISEALRGEGAYLLNERGERFMMDYEGRELAPRDLVSQVIYRQIEHQDRDHVYLDLRHLDSEKLELRFGDFLVQLKRYGIDGTRQLIPVAPAAHYCIGGVETGLNGETGIEGLYACGEVAATGVHGANRLASNSLLECLVFSRRAVDHAAASVFGSNGSESNFSSVQLYIDTGISRTFSEIKNRVAWLLNSYAGILRRREGLMQALGQIQQIRERYRFSDKEEYYSIRTEGLLRVSELIIHSALGREESLGVHQIDRPLPKEPASEIAVK